ncbi:histidine kinase [Ruminococcaceae bacterium OttesenSCG-928-A16]|nr:histidine kinase [Ruminococcaceae bacterium OttesenSCG-928-A16]
MGKVSWYRTVFFKVIVIFIIASMCLSGIATLMLTWQIHAMDDAMLKGFNKTVEYNLRSITRETQNVDQLSLGCVYDENAVRLAGAGETLSDYEMVTLINRLFGRLELLTESSKYIADAHMYFPSINRQLNAHHNLDFFSGQLEDIDGFTATGLRSLYQKTDDRLLSGYLPAGSSLENGSYRYVLVIEYDIGAIQDDIKNAMENDVSLMLFAPDNRSLLNLDPEGLWSNNSTAEPASEDWRNVNGTDYWVKVVVDQVTGLTLAAGIPKSSLNPQMRSLRTWLLIFAVALVLFAVGLFLSLAALVRSPLGKLTGAFTQMQKGDYSVRLKSWRKDEFGHIFEAFNHMAQNTQTLMDEVYQQTILAQNAQLKELQAWINPHFLYNSLFTISNMARLQETDSIKQFSEYLARYYQYLTKTSDSDFVFLSDEVEHSKLYVKIQKLRFGDDMRADFEEPPDKIKTWKIPRLLLQPMVENVFQHGFDKEGVRSIRVGFSLYKEKLVIAVEDNGHIEEAQILAMEQSLSGSTLSGIVNVHRRLRMQYGEDAGVRFSQSQMGGLKAELQIPWEEDKNAEDTGGG